MTVLHVQGLPPSSAPKHSWVATSTPASGGFLKNVLVYHNPDAMKYPASKVVEPVIVTNKRVGRNAIGDRIWLITGEGRPRRYYLRGYFTISEIQSGEDEGFRTRVRGNNEAFFDPMFDISHASWFGEMSRSQGNFAFGYQVIKDQSFVRELEALVKASPRGQPNER